MTNERYWQLDRLREIFLNEGRSPDTPVGYVRQAELVYMEKFQTKEEAMSREYHIKRMSREEKKRLIAEYEPSLSDNNCDSME